MPARMGWVLWNDDFVGQAEPNFHTDTLHFSSAHNIAATKMIILQYEHEHKLSLYAYYHVKYQSYPLSLLTSVHTGSLSILWACERKRIIH